MFMSDETIDIQIIGKKTKEKSIWYASKKQFYQIILSNSIDLPELK